MDALHEVASAVAHGLARLIGPLVETLAAWVEQPEPADRRSRSKRRGR